MNTEINHTSARFNLWRLAGRWSPKHRFSLGSLQAAAMSEFITELAVRKKRDGESLVRRRTMMKNAGGERVFHHCYPFVMKN